MSIIGPCRSQVRGMARDIQWNATFPLAEGGWGFLTSIWPDNRRGDQVHRLVTRYRPSARCRMHEQLIRIVTHSTACWLSPKLLTSLDTDLVSNSGE